MGLYFKFSIVLLYILIIAIHIIYKILKNEKNQARKFKLISFRRYFRYIKLVINKKIILLIIISSIISNSIVLIKDNKFNQLYKDEQKLTIRGVIVSDKEEKEYKDIYKIKIKYCNEYSKYKNEYLYIRISKKMNIEVNYGDEVIVEGQFLEPTGQRNYGGFNYKQYLKTLNICGSVNVEKIQIKDINKLNIIFYLANKLSCNIENKIDDILEKEEASVLKGILLGKTDDIEDKTYEQFRVSSISHILAVSGMHISYIIFGTSLLLKKNLGKRNTKYVIIFILIFYMFLTGFSASIVRATIMGIIVIVSGLVHRKNDIWTSIALSLICILIYNPFLIIDIGLQLSYIGTIGIILLNKTIFKVIRNIKLTKRNKKYKINRKRILFIKKMQEILSVTISAQISILPIILYHFNLFGTYFFISNLFVSIIIGPIIILGFLTIILSFIFYPISAMSANILKLMIKILVQISNVGNLPFSKIYFPTPKIWMIVLYYIFIVLFILIYPIYTKKKINTTQQRFRNIIALIKYKLRESNQKSIKILLVIFIIIIFFVHILPKNLKVNFVDVGQGDCTFIITPKNQTILIDGGGSKSNDFDVGKSTVLPYILDKGYTKIDYVIISHFDEDHVRSGCLQ